MFISILYNQASSPSSKRTRFSVQVLKVFDFLIMPYTGSLNECPSHVYFMSVKLSLASPVALAIVTLRRLWLVDQSLTYFCVLVQGKALKV